jgi:hypothetical protein
MVRLIVTAAASPLFGNFLMVVSVSAEADGLPTTGLKPQNFKIAHLASANHASVDVREVDNVSEGPDGFYIIQLKPSQPPTLSPGHYVFAVAVTAGTKTAAQHGQTVSVGDLPA